MRCQRFNYAFCYWKLHGFTFKLTIRSANNLTGKVLCVFAPSSGEGKLTRRKL